MDTSSTQFRLGFDGGGTKTRAVVIDGQLQVLGSGESGASNPYAVGMDAALDNIEAAADLALTAAGLNRAQITGWGMGLGGVCSASESAEVQGALRSRLGRWPKIVAVEDVVASWSGAFGGQAGEAPRALCIAGTGSNCWGQNAAGEVANADGVGPLLGDRGSGFWIGEQSLRHAARVADGVLPPDGFAAAVLRHFEAEDIKALIRVVYAPDFQRSNIAGLVPVVLQFAGEKAALEILTAAGKELALTSLAVLRKLNHGSEVLGEVALIGSILAHAEPVKASFLRALHEQAPRVELVPAQFEPAIGAALLA